MTSYLACMKKRKGMNDPECRDLAKSYLSCRMERYCHVISGVLHVLMGIENRNLMAKDEFKNLGFSEDPPAVDTKKDDPEKGVKGELRW